MPFGENINKAKPNTATENKVYLRDFRHAAKIFEPGAFDLAPKFKFLFHTYFDINPEAYSQSILTGSNFGLLVKTVKLPSFNLKTQEMNQYNRKRIIQSKITYDPISITFQDDNINVITKLWNAYYNYYYADESNLNGLYQNGGPLRPGNSINSYNNRNIYNSDIKDNNWGYVGESYKQGILTKVPFFRNITVFGFNRHNFTAYTLINPIITKVDHDQYNYSDGQGTMEIKMDINYETVAYNQGSMDGNTPENIVQGFGLQDSYDRIGSPLGAKEIRSIYNGRDGLKNAAGGFQKPLRDSDFSIDNR